jgi:hypothetical protein
MTPAAERSLNAASALAVADYRMPEVQFTEDWAAELERSQVDRARDLFLTRYRRLIIAAIRHYSQDYDDVMDVFAHACEADCQVKGRPTVPPFHYSIFHFDRSAIGNRLSANAPSQPSVGAVPLHPSPPLFPPRWGDDHTTRQAPTVRVGGPASAEGRCLPPRPATAAQRLTANDQRPTAPARVG